MLSRSFAQTIYILLHSISHAKESIFHCSSSAFKKIISIRNDFFKMRYALDKIRTFFEENPEFEL